MPFVTTTPPPRHASAWTVESIPGNMGNQEMGPHYCVSRLRRPRNRSIKVPSPAAQWSLWTRDDDDDNEYRHIPPMLPDEIERVDCTKILHVHFFDTLSPAQRINHLILQCSQRLFLLSQLKHQDQLRPYERHCSGCHTLQDNMLRSSGVDLS